jgi:hypothetical protein
MPVVRIDLEVDDKGSAKISQVSGQLKDLGGQCALGGRRDQERLHGADRTQALDGQLSVAEGSADGPARRRQAAIDYGGHLTDMEARTGVAVEGSRSSTTPRSSSA